MYPLNTTLIFTELAEAAAAARLFGVYALQTQEGKGWSDKFSSVVEKGWETWQAERWRIVLDTEEKVQWFTVQVGDFIADGIIGGVVKRVLSDGVDYETCCATNFCHSNSIKILYRDGKPFPQPQEVRHD